MLKQSDYIKIDAETIAIGCCVAKPIDFNLINENFSRVIFLNQNDDYTNINMKINLSLSIYTYENSVLNYDYDWEPHFNHRINLSENIERITFGLFFNRLICLTNCTRLTHLIFGECFDRPIKLTNKLTHLIFGDCFNQSIELVNSLTHLIFGNSFNQSIELVNSLTHLIFGYEFNQPINLTNNSELTHLILGKKFSHPVNLPNIKYLLINSNNANLIENLPDSLESLILGRDFNFPLVNLPNSIKYMKILNFNYNILTIIFPINLKLIKCDYRSKYLNDLKNYKLEFNKDFIIEI